MEFLLEIMTEEMPPSHIKSAIDQLKLGFTGQLRSFGLVDQKGRTGRIQVYGTCRRLIIHGELAARQQDREEEMVGPPKAAAYTSEGDPKPAAIGFAKSKGVDVKDLIVLKTERGEYVGVRKVVEGQTAAEILTRSLPQLVSGISFPKMMRWGDNPFRFTRPIKNIFCILDGSPLRISVGGLTSTDFTFGHFLLSPKKIRVKTFADYKKVLQENKVIISLEKRQEKIIKSIERKLARSDEEATLFMDDELLEKLSYDVEWPLIIMGSFPEEYLRLPIEVLSTAMKKGQNLFSVVKGKKQMNRFIGVADADNDSMGLIRKGNERVLKARLEDAKFFWEQDLSVPMNSRINDLQRITYQEQLGSYTEKIERVGKLVSYLADKFDFRKEKKILSEAVKLSKVDLTTDMVREFPSLQGIVGGLYAKEEKYPAALWRAVYEHYQPASMEGDIPSSMNGVIISLADKLDSIIGAMGLGFKVTGSKDPFGLRRNGQSICRLILGKKLDLSLSRLLDKSLKIFGDKLKVPSQDVKDSCMEFFRSRLEYIYSSQGYRYDLIHAALAPGIDNIQHSFLRLKALDSLKTSPHFEPLILISKRVNNILKDHPKYRINAELFHEKEERELHTTLTIIKDNVLQLIGNGEFSSAQRMVFRMRATIDNFFDRILVMDEDVKIRRNRLALLQEISRLFSKIADYSKIVVSDN
ncbi:glycine--tRNA ligase subunit beta [Acidobacteriota bacterium]